MYAPNANAKIPINQRMFDASPVWAVFNEPLFEELSFPLLLLLFLLFLPLALLFLFKLPFSLPLFDVALCDFLVVFLPLFFFVVFLFVSPAVL